MLVLSFSKILGERDKARIRGAVEDRVLDSLVEFVVAQTAVFDKRLQIVPQLLVALALIVKHRIQLVRDLLHDVSRNLRDISAVL